MFTNGILGNGLAFDLAIYNDEKERHDLIVKLSAKTDISVSQLKQKTIAELRSLLNTFGVQANID